MNNTCCAVLNTWHELNVSPFLAEAQRFVVAVNYWFCGPATKDQKGENLAKVLESCKICCEKSKNTLSLSLKNTSCWHALHFSPLIPRTQLDRNLLMTLLLDTKYTFLWLLRKPLSSFDIFSFILHPVVGTPCLSPPKNLLMRQKILCCIIHPIR